jgi:hypothetical protein
MQLTPRYLVNERIIVVSNDAGFVVEYRPVYSRTQKVYKGIDNTLQFRLLNADQKPVTIVDTPVIVVFDESNTKVFEQTCTVTDDGSTTATKGMFEVTFYDNDLLNLRQQYLHYNIYMQRGHTKTVTYANRNFESAGIIYLDGNAYPGPKSSTEVINFHFRDDYWYAGSDDSDKITADPGLNSNEALHTVAVYTDEFVGDLEIQATLDNQIDGFNNWSTVNTITFDGTETEPVYANFNGIFSYLRFKIGTDPTDKITKILIRN